MRLAVMSIVFARGKVHGAGIDAITGAGGGGAVIENMTEMGTAAGAGNFGAYHSVTEVGRNLGTAGNRTVKTGPTAAGIEFVAGTENRVSASGTAESSVFLNFQIFSGKSRFCAFLAQNAILFRGKAFFPLFVTAFERRLGSGTATSSLFGKVFLMILFRRIKFGGRNHLSDDRRRVGFALVQFCDFIQRGLLLLGREVKDCRSVLIADVRPLTIERGRIMVGKKISSSCS